MIHYVQHRAVQVLLTLSIYLITANYLPLEVHQGLYTISVFIKDILVWMLPVTVCVFIAHTICSFQRKAPLFIAAIILFEALSNFSSVIYAFLTGNVAAELLPPLTLPTASQDFCTLWHLPFSKPSWWSADKGSILGVIIGLIIAFSNKPSLVMYMNQAKNIAQTVLTKFFSRLIPLFILGFVASMYQTKLLQHVCSHYAPLLLWLVAFLGTYIFALFYLGSNGTLKDTFRAIKNLIPAGSLAFTSGCSLSTMPWTIEGSSKNLEDPDFAKAIIPATTNIQQIGDCITNSFLCFILYTQFFGHSPDFITWLHFSAVFVLARFATAAVIGGAIFIMLPVYEIYLSFTPEMIAIILAFNVVLDPLVTATNVIANGALCRVFEKVWLKFFLKKEFKKSPS
jgi:Na+/H+-dicarboxylate symporter